MYGAKTAYSTCWLVSNKDRDLHCLKSHLKVIGKTYCFEILKIKQNDLIISKKSSLYLSQQANAFLDT